MNGDDERSASFAVGDGTNAEFFCHERLQFVGVVRQVVQDFGDGHLHRFEGVVPSSKGMLSEKLPQAFDQI